MKRWQDIEIDTRLLPELFDTVKGKINFNPACQLRTCWTEKMNKGIEKDAIEKNRLGYGFVGDGYPISKDQTQALQYDQLSLRNAFPEWNFRDVGDAIYQANLIIPQIKFNFLRRNYIVDFGSGYGRLAIPFIYHARKNGIPLTYIGIDFSASGLLTAPQFVKQAMGESISVRDWKTEGDLDRFDFVSLPAWRIQDLDTLGVEIDLFMTVHSFQEMTKEAISFYISNMNRHTVPSSLFYSVNWNMEIEQYISESEWNVIHKQPYPLNRDGNYFEVLFKRF
jgi:SAM-dependent methyltransferase